MKKYLIPVVALAAVSSAPAAAATLITDATVLANTIITPTPAFGALTEAVGNQTTITGIDFSFGNVEGIFDDGGAFGFCGINAAGNCDLVTDVDGAIVGFASFISAEAGFSADGTLTLSVFDSSMNLLESALNGPPLGANGRSTFSISRASADIAFFRIAGNDSYGVNQITLDGVVPFNGAVPEPGTWAMMLLGFGFIGGAMRSAKRKQKVTVSYA